MRRFTVLLTDIERGFHAFYIDAKDYKSAVMKAMKQYFKEKSLKYSEENEEEHQVEVLGVIKGYAQFLM